MFYSFILWLSSPNYTVTFFVLFNWDFYFYFLISFGFFGIWFKCCWIFTEQWVVLFRLRKPWLLGCLCSIPLCPSFRIFLNKSHQGMSMTERDWIVLLGFFSVCWLEQIWCVDEQWTWLINVSVFCFWVCF